MAKRLLFLSIFCFIVDELEAQNCSTLYVITSLDGKIYSINVATGNKTLVTTMTEGRENLAVGPNPTSTGTTVFTNEKKKNEVYKSSIYLNTDLPKEVKGFTANPATTGPKAGYVYGISSNRELIKASPAPATNLGTITGDAIWEDGTVEGEGFFDNSGNLFTSSLNSLFALFMKKRTLLYLCFKI